MMMMTTTITITNMYKYNDSVYGNTTTRGLYLETN